MVSLRSLCRTSWPAAKVTVITVASVKTQMCKNHLLGWYTWDTNYFVVIVHGVDHKKLLILFYGYDHVHIPRNNLRPSCKILIPDLHFLSKGCNFIIVACVQMLYSINKLTQ